MPAWLSGAWLPWRHIFLVDQAPIAFLLANIKPLLSFLTTLFVDFAVFLQRTTRITSEMRAEDAAASEGVCLLCPVCVIS